MSVVGFTDNHSLICAIEEQLQSTNSDVSLLLSHLHAIELAEQKTSTELCLFVQKRQALQSANELFDIIPHRLRPLKKDVRSLASNIDEASRFVSFINQSTNLTNQMK